MSFAVIGAVTGVASLGLSAVNTFKKKDTPSNIQPGVFAEQPPTSNLSQIGADIPPTGAPSAAPLPPTTVLPTGATPSSPGAAAPYPTGVVTSSPIPDVKTPEAASTTLGDVTSGINAGSQLLNTGMNLLGPGPAVAANYRPNAYGSQQAADDNLMNSLINLSKSQKRSNYERWKKQINTGKYF